MKTKDDAKVHPLVETGNVEVTSRCFNLHNLETSRGRRNHAVLILIVSLTPVFALIGQNLQTVANNSVLLKNTESTQDSIQLSIQTGNLIHRLQIERGTTAFYIGSGGDPSVLAKLKVTYNMTDNAISKLDRWRENDNGVHYETINSYAKYLLDFRDSFDPSAVTVDEAIDFYTSHNKIFISWFASNLQTSVTSTLWSTLVSYHFLVLAKEDAGIERARGSTFYARGGFDQSDMLKYAARRVMGDSYLRQSSEYSSIVKKSIDSEYNNQQLAEDINHMRLEIKTNNITSSSVVAGNAWFENMTLFINVLQDINIELAKHVTSALFDEMANLENEFIISIVIVVCSILLCPFVIVTVRVLTKRIQIYAEKLQAKTLDLEKERHKSEMLLYELLPVSVANRLLQDLPVQPEFYSSATIFFSDIVGFTKISSKSTPLQIVNMLNMLYKTFDNYLELYDVYKVETIGDAYVVASGLPVRNGNKHVIEIGHLALDLLDAIANLTVPHIPTEQLKLRIGINTGPVVTGVVGNKMPRYCLFGDTVNTASRMESSSLPHKIQISASTKDEMETCGDFIVNIRGDIDVKGKGLMTTYWLEGRSTTPTPSANRKETSEFIYSRNTNFAF